MSETEETRPILCGECRVEVKERTNPDGGTILFCPNCGNFDTRDNVAREIQEYLFDQISGEAEQFEGFGNIAEVQITVTETPERKFRFIV